MKKAFHIIDDWINIRPKFLLSFSMLRQPSSLNPMKPNPMQVDFESTTVISNVFLVLSAPSKIAPISRQGKRRLKFAET
jgi:hypothetical protein